MSVHPGGGKNGVPENPLVPHVELPLPLLLLPLLLWLFPLLLLPLLLLLLLLLLLPLLLLLLSSLLSCSPMSNRCNSLYEYTTYVIFLVVIALTVISTLERFLFIVAIIRAMTVSRSMVKGEWKEGRARRRLNRLYIGTLIRESSYIDQRITHLELPIASVSTRPDGPPSEA